MTTSDWLKSTCLIRPNSYCLIHFLKSLRRWSCYCPGFKLSLEINSHNSFHVATNLCPINLEYSSQNDKWKELYGVGIQRENKWCSSELEK